MAPLRLLDLLVATLQLAGLSSAQGFEFTAEQKYNANRTLSIGYIVYHGFQILDVFGPLDLLHGVSSRLNMSLSIIAEKTGPVQVRTPPHKMAGGTTMDNSQALDAAIVATHTFATAPPLDIVIVPGGIGNRALVQGNNNLIEEFVARRFDATDYVLSVCTGSALLARAGVLDDRRATTNKAAWAFPIQFGRNVTWVPSARWVRDGKVWTSSGVAAGMDMIYAFLRHIYGDPVVNNAFNGAEYAPHVDPDWDPFSIMHKVPGADMTRSMTDCASVR